jgi:hypothetical protein
LAAPIRSGSVVNSPAFIPTLIFQIERGASREKANFVDVLPDRQPDGRFSFSRDRLDQIFGSRLPDGSHTLAFQAQDENGNLSSLVSYAFTLDTLVNPPSNLQLLADSDTGQSNSDRITNLNTPTIRGLADPNTVIQVFDNGSLVAQAIASTTGTWTLMSSPLSNGTHSLVAIAADIAGNVSQVSQPLEFVVDAVQPLLNVSTALETQPLNNGARLVGTIDGTGSAITSLSYRFDDRNEISLAFNPATGEFDQAFNFTGIGNGAHTLSITSVDIAGNKKVDQYNVVITVDREAPVLNADLQKDTAFNGTTNGDRITFNPTIIGNVTDASQIVSFRAGLNDTDPNQFIDVLPQRQIDGRFTLERSHLEQIYGAPIPDGIHTLKLQAKDAYDNLSEVFSFSFTLDTTPPPVPIPDLNTESDGGQSQTDNVTNSTTPLVIGTAEAGSSIQLLRDGTVIETISSDGQWQIVSSQLPDGT